MDKLNMNTVTVQCGVDYATVESRVRAFCSEHQNGQILTEMVKCEDDTGEVIFKALAVVDGVIKGTGHASEFKGSTNINKTSHVEVCETSAVGRALAMMGYMSKGQIASYEEIENARLQRVEMKKDERKLEADIASLSIRFKKAIETEDEEQIDECQADMRGNQLLRQGVNETLSSSDKQYMIERNEKYLDEIRNRREMRETRNQAYAKEFAEKQMQMQKNKNFNG